MTWLRLGALRALPVGVAVFAVFAVFLGVPVLVIGDDLAAVEILLPFLAAAICTACAPAVLGPVDRIIERFTRLRATTPYSALAETVARIRTGKLDTALPGLAKVLADGTAARQAGIWVVAADGLEAAAVHPPPGGPPPTAADLAELLDRPDVDHLVPVLDQGVLRAALTIGKPGASITVGDMELMRDVANGARLLLRGVALTAQLRERVRQAANLSVELDRSRKRLALARALERRRLAGELERATVDRLAVVRSLLDGARRDLVAQRKEVTEAGLAQARVSLDETLERFRTIARGVFPAVLRDQGTVAALEELVVDLPREVDLRSSLDRRLAWEVESGIYYLAASAMHRLAEQPGPPLRMSLRHSEGRLAVEIVDPRPAVSANELQDALVNDLERLAALGGAVDLGMDGTAIVLVASLPEQLEPLVVPSP